MGCYLQSYLGMGTYYSNQWPACSRSLFYRQQVLIMHQAALIIILKEILLAARCLKKIPTFVGIFYG
jgi:hypothetical protein